jgi:arylsulfatase A-like enzyme
VNQPPNILVLLADQLRRDAINCFGGRDAATPHIDALAARGVRFGAASSTCPVCVPYRFSLLTGVPAHSRWVPTIDWRMSPAERTLADAFDEIGYETAYVGKWHLDGGYGVRPGFEESEIGRRAIPRSRRGRFERWRGFELRNNPFDTFVFNDDDPEPHRLAGYQTDALFDIAAELVRSRDRRRPMFGIVSVEPPHPPYLVPESYGQRWRERELGLPPNFAAANASDELVLLDERRNYFAAVENLDDNVGRLVDVLRAEEIEDNTVIVFLADHGDLGGSHGLRDKQWPYEESVGVPLIVADPSATSAHGSVVDAPVCTEDLFPTLLGLAGVAEHAGPGIDLSGFVRGTEERLAREAVVLELVAERRWQMPFFVESWRGLRTAEVKYTVLGPADSGSPWQLFDLREDPFEQHNLLSTSEGRRQAVELHEWLAAMLAEREDLYTLRPEGLDAIHRTV